MAMFISCLLVYQAGYVRWSSWVIDLWSSQQSSLSLSFLDFLASGMRRKMDVSLGKSEEKKWSLPWNKSCRFQFFQFFQFQFSPFNSGTIRNWAYDLSVLLSFRESLIFEGNIQVLGVLPLTKSVNLLHFIITLYQLDHDCICCTLKTSSLHIIFYGFCMSYHSAKTHWFSRYLQFFLEGVQY